MATELCVTYLITTITFLIVIPTRASALQSTSTVSFDTDNNTYLTSLFDKHSPCPGGNCTGDHEEYIEYIDDMKQNHTALLNNFANMSSNQSWTFRLFDGRAKNQIADQALLAIQAALASPRGDGNFFFESPKGIWILADVVVSLLAIFANVVFIDAIRNIKLELRGYRLFLINLSVTDIFTAVICLANFTHQAISNYTQSLLVQKCGVNVLRSLNIAGLLSNLFSLFGMSIDHYIGVFHPLRYQQIMGNARVVNSAIILIWMISLLSAVIDSLILLTKYFIFNERNTANNSFGGQQAAVSTAATLSLLSLTSSKRRAGNNSFFLDDVTETPSLWINVTGAEMLTEKVLSLMPMLHSDLTSLDSSSSSEELSMDYEVTNTPTAPSALTTATSSSEYPFPLDDGDQFDPVDEIMNFYSGSVLPNDSSILEEFIRRIILKDSEPHMLGWCSYHAAEKLWFELFVIGLTIVVFSTLVPIYCRILRQVMLAQEWNVRKLIVTTLLLLGAFLLCRVPFVLFEVLMVVLMRVGYMRTNGSHLRMMDINNVLNTMLMFFPLLDPIIYTIRMRAVQRYMAWRFGKCCPSLFLYCFGREIPDSQTAKRFSTFTYALSRGSFSGPSGTTRRFSLLSRRTPTISQSIPSQLHDVASVTGSCASTRPLLDRFVPHRLSLLFSNSRMPNAARSGGGSNRILIRESLRMTSVNGSFFRRRSLSFHRTRMPPDALSSINSSSIGKKMSLLRNHSDTSQGRHALEIEMAPLTQLRFEDEISGALSTIEEPLENAVILEPLIIASPSPVTIPDVQLQIANDQLVLDDDDVFFGQNAYCSTNIIFVVNKVNNYFAKASFVGEQHDGKTDSDVSEAAFDADLASVNKLKAQQRASLYERFLFKVRRLKMSASSVALSSSPYVGLLDSSDSGSTGAYEPESHAHFTCVCGCDDALYGIDSEFRDDGLAFLMATGSKLDSKSITSLTTNLYDQQHQNQHSQQRHHHHYCRSPSPSVAANPSAPLKPLLISNNAILNKLALHTKKLFELETKMLTVSLSSALVSSPAANY